MKTRVIHVLSVLAVLGAAGVSMAVNAAVLAAADPTLPAGQVAILDPASEPASSPSTVATPTPAVVDPAPPPAPAAVVPAPTRGSDDSEPESHEEGDDD